MKTLQELKEEYIRLQTNIENVEKSYKKARKEIISLNKELDIYKEAKNIISSSMKSVQEGFKNTIEVPVNEVLGFVYQDSDFKFVLDVKERTNGYEWEPKILDGGRDVFNIKEDGGGLVSVIGFVFQIIFHMVSSKESRNVLCFDEPVSNIGDLTGRFGEIVEVLSEKFGIQFLISTHSKDLKSLNGKRFEIKRKGVSSSISELEF